MIEVKFGKDRYHQQQLMVSWCKQYLGKDDGWGSYKKDGKDRWGIDAGFGNTFFYFRDEEDASAFVLVWM